MNTYNKPCVSKSIRMTKELSEKIDTVAAKRQRSFNYTLCELLDDLLNENDSEGKQHD